MRSSVFVFLYLVWFIALGQFIYPSDSVVAQTHSITAEVIGESYDLWVFLPTSYVEADTVQYPVLFVLDGKRDQRKLANQLPQLQLEEVLIVAISRREDDGFWIDRTKDYSPFISPTRERSMKKKYGLEESLQTTGGGPDFLRFLKTEVTPFLEQQYRINQDRGITGHSLGGLFTTYALMEGDGFFTRIGIHSPSLWWEKRTYFKQVQDQIAAGELERLPSTQLLITVGGREPKSMVKFAKTFSSSVQEEELENVKTSFSLYKGETHGSMIPIALRQTLLELYGAK